MGNRPRIIITKLEKKSRQKVTLRHFLDSKWKIFAIVLHVPNCNRVRLKVVISGHSGAIIRELSFKGHTIKEKPKSKTSNKLFNEL